jgi:peptidoglycan-N-acetylglucosamine deacetylase
MRRGLLRTTLGACLTLAGATAWGQGWDTEPTPTSAPTTAPAASPRRPAPRANLEHLVDDNPKLREQGYPPAAVVRARHEYELERGIEFPILVRGDRRQPTIALTFDDGPHTDCTPKLLDILRREGVKATFFVVGSEVDKHPKLLLDEVLAGHEVANHTYHHLRLPTIPAQHVESELLDGAEAIRHATGTTTRLYRPPGGEYDREVIAATKKLNMVMVLWTDDPGDYTEPGAKVIERRTLQDVSNGSIILLHDGVQQTVDILPDLIHRLKGRGFRFVTCSEMARERNVIKTGGPTVTSSRR